LILNVMNNIGVVDETIGDSAKYTYSEFEGQPVDHAVYLDKSARPISALVDGLWDSLAEAGAKKPDSSFVNIDKEIWLQYMNVPASRFQNPKEEDYNFDNIDPSLLNDRINQLRAIYVQQDRLGDIDENNLDSCKNLPTTLDGKNVLIVDEVESSGYTLKIALELYKRAFPEAKFGTAYWVSPRKLSWSVTEKDGTETKEFASTWVPFWYDANTAFGRGIGDIDPVYSSHSTDIRTRIGRFLLSAPINQPTEGGFEIIEDKRSQQTYDDLELLVERFKQRKVLYKPNPDRKDYEQRAVSMNGLSSMSEFIANLRKF
jgi:hypothetical protein